MKKSRIIITAILAVSLLLGYSIARYGGWAVKQEKVRSTERTGVSGGTYGFPLQASVYFCPAEDKCYHSSHHSNYYGPIHGVWLNTLILTGAIAGLTFLVRYLALRKT